MATINKVRLRRIVNPQLDKAIRPAASKILIEKFVAAKKEALTNFENHPITKDLEGGPEYSGPSIAKGSHGGNLFSLLGFYADEKPIEELRAKLDEKISKGVVRKSETKNGDLKYTLYVKVPTIESLADGLPTLDWGNGNWLLMIENGIDGFQHYLFDSTKEFRNSKSGPAIQAKKLLGDRNESTAPTEYMKEILEKLKEQLES